MLVIIRLDNRFPSVGPLEIRLVCALVKMLLATYAGCFAYDKRNKTEVVDYLVEYCEERGNVTIDKDWYEKSYQNFLEKAKTAQEIPISIKLSRSMCHSNLMRLKCNSIKKDTIILWVTTMIHCITGLVL